MANDTSRKEHADNSPGRASDEVHARIDEAAESVKQGASAAASRAEDSLHRTADIGGRGAHRAADTAAQWCQRGASVTGDTRECVTNLYGFACDFVRERPVESVAIALAAGWLVGRVLSSRR